MIIKFQNKEGAVIGINPAQVASVDRADDLPNLMSESFAIIHLIDGQQRTVIGKVEEIINKLNQPRKTNGYGGSVAV